MTKPPRTDAEAFRAFEHSGWDRAARQYHDRLATVTTQAVSALLEAAGVAEGTRVLDVATGAGYAAAAAAELGAEAVGLDISAVQVDLARRLYPGVDFRRGDAEELPFPDGTFDAVVVNFGLLHFPQPERALAEARRVLRPGGRVAFTWWAGADEVVGLAIALRAIERHGNPDVPLPPGPSFFRFSDPEECRRTLAEAGFEEPGVTRVPQVWSCASADELFQGIHGGTVRMGAVLRHQSPQALAAIRDAMREEAAAYRAGDRLAIPMPALLASATKP